MVVMSCLVSCLKKMWRQKSIGNKISFSKGWLLLSSLMLCHLSVVGESAMDLTEPGAVIKGFSIPRFDNKGQTIAQLHGESAKIIDSSNILLQNIRYEVTTTNQPYFKFETESGVFNRKTEYLTSKKRVHFYRSNFKISGTGLIWSLKESQCQLKSNVVMRIQNMEKGLTK